MGGKYVPANGCETGVAGGSVKELEQERVSQLED
jgi:hypothetical protein